ncbi:transmembrane protein, putative (macronuclear) [Tetrahymena thermophila SB210]|uniref:Transmembrane protein, putative n=1 Tax=Tetrahymena thermophila (strain SB210) TaxID=312017 RepID=I7M9V9_TETTS|nr:transmembrane protein, putative [Tetrahymena thermophila SB210]EAS02916.2 transmembrane protein, putative [Tetrahymena thermophila SB210]|eukprot:XP_001023161.2 transmembrane protein, putative [Tetrahymena thermophila SB210]
MDQNYNNILKQKKQYTILVLSIIFLFVIILAFGDLKGLFGKRAIIALIILFTSSLYFIWKDELKAKGFQFGFRRSKGINSQPKFPFRQQNSSGIKQNSKLSTPQHTYQKDQSLNSGSQQKNIVVEKNQGLNNSFLQSQNRLSGQQENQIYMRYPSDSFSQRNFESRHDSLYNQNQHGNKKEIQSRKITEVRKWGNKGQNDQNGLLGVASQKKQISQTFQINESVNNEENKYQKRKSERLNQSDKTRSDREALFELTLKKQNEFQTNEQFMNAIQKSKIYCFHIIKERVSTQLKNILEINKLLFEQFNLILMEAELAQNTIQELENRFDLINSDKRRVTIDDLYSFKNTFQRQKHSIWHLPYDHQINLELINQLIEMIESREELDTVLEVRGYDFFEIRTHVLTRLFYMYNTQDCDDDQKKQIQDKYPADIEIVAHCLFLNINEICSQQKDLSPCKIDKFDIQSENQIIPVHGVQIERFFFLVCNKINFEPYYILQVGSDVFYTAQVNIHIKQNFHEIYYLLNTQQGPLSFFCALVFYFMYLKNNVFHTLSQSECKEILESPAKYILNYENEYRKGLDRYYI